VLFKTRNSELWEWDSFDKGFTRIGLAAAQRLVENGVRLVGVDYLSIGDPETHETLLRAGIAAIEGLDLRVSSRGNTPLPVSRHSLGVTDIEDEKRLGMR
jgi:arylformamidase